MAPEFLLGIEAYRFGKLGNYIRIGWRVLEAERGDLRT